MDVPILMLLVFSAGGGQPCTADTTLLGLLDGGVDILGPRTVYGNSDQFVAHVPLAQAAGLGRALDDFQADLVRRFHEHYLGGLGSTRL